MKQYPNLTDQVDDDSDDSPLDESASELEDDTTSLNSSHTPSSHNNESRALREVKQIAGIETKRMRFWKFASILGILLTGAGVCCGVYIFLRNKEENDFESEVR